MNSSYFRAVYSFTCYSSYAEIFWSPFKYLNQNAYWHKLPQLKNYLGSKVFPNLSIQQSNFLSMLLNPKTEPISTPQFEQKDQHDMTTAQSNSRRQKDASRSGNRSRTHKGPTEERKPAISMSRRKKPARSILQRQGQPARSSKTGPNQEAQGSSFLSLATELRCMIYEYCDCTALASLMRTGRYLHEEAKPFLWDSVWFCYNHKVKDFANSPHITCESGTRNSKELPFCREKAKNVRNLAMHIDVAEMDAQTGSGIDQIDFEGILGYFPSLKRLNLGDFGFANISKFSTRCMWGRKTLGFQFLNQIPAHITLGWRPDPAIKEAIENPGAVWYDLHDHTGREDFATLLDMIVKFVTENPDWRNSILAQVDEMLMGRDPTWRRKCRDNGPPRCMLPETDEKITEGIKASIVACREAITKCSAMRTQQPALSEILRKEESKLRIAIQMHTQRLSKFAPNFRTCRLTPTTSTLRIVVRHGAVLYRDAL
ncbi:hypothetical protein EJ08DRAFT_732779 [Tothia fuscella]|uniref:Uncharacterized protein n=1 Tax=Tothia fuscella TaxID=1048955 RepID=A0A9P4NTQ6_9PEZI|nr:hypothetical protein EJ08DRAFT_732779 [Tothia fuscella]